MLNTIERRLAEWSDLTLDGVPADAIFANPDYDTYRRAFRLKRFQRCPSCDEKALNMTSEDFVHSGRYVWCSHCQWSVFIWDCFELDPDNLILDIVRGVPV